MRIPHASYAIRLYSDEMRLFSSVAKATLWLMQLTPENKVDEVLTKMCNEIY